MKMWDSDQYKQLSKPMLHHHHLASKHHHHRKEQSLSSPPHPGIVSSSSSSSSSAPSSPGSSSPWHSSPFSTSSPSSTMKKTNNNALKIPRKRKRLDHSDHFPEEEKKDVVLEEKSTSKQLHMEGVALNQQQKSNLNLKRRRDLNIIQVMEGPRMNTSSSSLFSSSMEGGNHCSDSESSSSSEEELEFDSSYEEEEEEQLKRRANQQQFLSIQELKRLKMLNQQYPIKRTEKMEQKRSSRITTHHPTTRKRSRAHQNGAGAGAAEQHHQQRLKDIDLINILSSSMECSTNGISDLSPSSSSALAAQNPNEGREAASPNNEERAGADNNDMSSSSSSGVASKKKEWKASASSMSISFRPPLLSLNQEEHSELSSSLRKSKQKNNVGCVVTIHANCHSSTSQQEEITSVILNQVTSIESLISLVEEKLHTTHQNSHGNYKSSQSSSSSVSFSATDKNQLLTILNSRKVSGVKNSCASAKIQKKQKIKTTSSSNKDEYNHNPNIYAKSIKSLICTTTDDLNTIVDAVVAFRDFTHHPVIGKNELSWWSHRNPSAIYNKAKDTFGTRNLAFLRRMLLPICCRVVIVQQHHDVKVEDSTDGVKERNRIKQDATSSMTSSTASTNHEKISIKCKLLSHREAIPVSPPPPPLYHSATAATESDCDNHKNDKIHNTSVSLHPSSNEKATKLNVEMQVKEESSSSVTETPLQETQSSTFSKATTTKKLCIVSYSLIDVLLQIQHLQPFILSALLCRVYQLDEGIHRATTATSAKSSAAVTTEDNDRKVITDLHRNLRNLILSTINNISSIVDKVSFLDMISSIINKSSQKDRLRNELCNALSTLLCHDDVTDEKIKERQRKIVNKMSFSSSDKIVRKEDRKRKRGGEIMVHHHLDWWSGVAGTDMLKNKSDIAMKSIHNQSPQTLLYGVGDSRGAAVATPVLPIHLACANTPNTSASTTPNTSASTTPLTAASKNSNKNGEDNSNAIIIKEQVPIIERCKMEAKSCPDWKRSEVMSIRKEREKILRNRRIMLEKKVNQNGKQYMMKHGGGSGAGAGIRRSNRRVKPQGRSYDGSLIISSQDMSIDEFLSRTALMSKVNATLPRLFIPDISRPTLRRLSISKQTLDELQSLFFDSDGSLSNLIRNDVDMSVKNGYINFENRACLVQRRDKRWQVPFRLHGVGYEVETRAKVEALFRKEGVLIPFRECLDDLGLLFGGTEDQSLHHDTARQITSWVDEKPLTDDVISSLNPVSGWEIDRMEYNDAMSSPVAPSSIIVGLGGNEEVLLGVQKDQIDKVGDGKSCKIHGGLDETFPIVRQNDHLVVIRVKTGCMFTGDFPHAGVRNIRPSTHEDHLMGKFNDKIMDIINEYPAREHVMRTKAIIDMMCNFPGLDKLCRLHCSTEMLEGNLCIPPNTIGFSECLPNLPDIKCHENDPMDQCYEGENIDEKDAFDVDGKIDDFNNGDDLNHDAGHIQGRGR